MTANVGATVKVQDRAKTMKHRSGRVLIDARLLAYRRGGISRYIDGLTEWLPRVAPDLPFARVVNRPIARSKSPDICVRTPPHFRFERVSLGVELSLRSPALLHSTDFIAPILPGVRHVVTVHDLAFLLYPALLSKDALRYYGQIERSLRVADRVIAVSAYTAGQLSEITNVANDKIVIVHNGADERRVSIDRAEASTILRRELGDETTSRILENRPVILAVGTIEPRKRQQLLLQAIERPPLCDAQTAPLLILVGQKGWACDAIVADIERASAAGRVIWLDDASDNTLAALYCLATVLALPSLDEGFGLPLLEAMAADLVVVASRRGALPEVAGDAAVLLDSDDPSAWAEALHGIIVDCTRREALIALGRLRAAEYTWERTARRTADVYREVLRQ